MLRLADNQIINNYKVVYYIKETLYCSSYRVTDLEGKAFFMKLFDLHTMPHDLLVDGVPKEIAICKRLVHKNLLSYVDSGFILLKGIAFAYLVTDFFNGELLSDALLFNGLLTLDDKYLIARGITKGLQYMSDIEGLSHNDICPHNIILVSDPETVRLIPKIIDLGHASEPFEGIPAFPEEDIDVMFRAPETFYGNYSYKSDVFSLSVLIYLMLFGHLPWDIEFNQKADYQTKIRFLLEQRTFPIELPTDNYDISTLLHKGLSESPDNRPTYDELLILLPAIVELNNSQLNCKVEKENNFKQGSALVENRGGFDDVAGMDAIKKELTDKVIWVLKNKVIAARYRITPPNGMLLYGPPGCGKTFFAQKFAEESGFNYQLINGSDIGSTLVHGNQIRIGELFKEAEKNAPTVLCFDEFDAFVPIRGARGAEYAAEEVNEFLSQLNNCSQRGIFVIGTTNRKDMIDPAVLRKGRLDLLYYISEPDYETRKLIFKKHLNKRPLSDGIDYNILAEMTNHYASSDIAYIVNEAALAAALAGELIGQHHLEGAIKGNRSSLKSS